MRWLCGEYSWRGYTIYDPDGGRDVYSAGNSPLDSQQYVDRRHGVPLDTLRQYCDQTGREIAEEQGAVWCGCERVEE